MSNRFPIILCDCLRPCKALDRVYVDESHGISCAVNHLLSKGHTTLGSISDIKDAPRIHMFLDHLQANGIPTPPELHILTNEHDYASGYQAVYQLHQQGILPTALFCVRDAVAIGALRAAYELQLAVPQQLSIVGYDDGKIAEFAYRPLTTIHQPVAQIADSVVQCVLNRLNDPDQPPKEIRLIPEFIVRQST